MSHEGRLASGMVPLDRDAIERLPETSAHYRLLSSGQRVMSVGHAGETGLREVIRDAWTNAPVAGVTLIEYSETATAEEARVAAEAELSILKPLYNEGYGRFRNSEISLPKKGHRIREAMKNP